MGNIVELPVEPEEETIPLDIEELRVIEAISPTAVVERVEGGARLTVHDLNGTTVADIYDGDNGKAGKQANWNEEDSEDMSFIKNKPFCAYPQNGAGAAIYPQTSLTFERAGFHYWYVSANIFGTLYNVPIDGGYYTIEINGQKHTYPAVVSDNIITIGAADSNAPVEEYSAGASFTKDGDEWQLFCVYSQDSRTTQTVVIYKADAVISKLDTDYVDMSYGAGTGGGSFRLIGNVASGAKSVAIGTGTLASGAFSHAEGVFTTASSSSHAEGEGTTASAQASHAEGQNTIASATAAHAEGNNAQAKSNYAHAEGQNTVALGVASHAEGDTTTASGNASHAEGQYTSANAYQHVLGRLNASVLYSDVWPLWVAGTSYAVGDKAMAEEIVGPYTIVHPYYCIEANSDNVFTASKWREWDGASVAEIVGNGMRLDGTTKSNARILDWDGNERLAGGLTLGGSLTIGNTTITEAQLQTLLATLN